MNLQFRSILDKRSIATHTNKKANVSILNISIRRYFTNDSDLIKVGDGDTFIHIFTYKKKKEKNTNLALISVIEFRARNEGDYIIA